MKARLKSVPLKRTTADSTGVTQKADSLDLAHLVWLKNEEQRLYNRADSLVRSDIGKANGLLGIGWQTSKFASMDMLSAFKSVLGWLITAIAISLGAPFWFDLLSKLMKLKNTTATTNPQEKEKLPTI